MGVASINQAVEDSVVGKFFKFKERKTTFTAELRGGLVSFLTVCYILPVNSSILTDTGGICITAGGIDGAPACPFGPGSFGDPTCEDCLAASRKSFISATAIACVISHTLMGLLANLPLAIAPAMGINAFFAYTVVGFMGTGQFGVTYQQAITAAFIEGFIFLAISLVGLRAHIVKLIPRCILLATSAGIGLFLAFIGLQNAEGVGVVASNPATLVGLGGCAPEYRSSQWTFIGPPSTKAPAPDSVCTYNDTTGELGLTTTWLPGSNYVCASAGIMRSPTMWLGIGAGILIAVLMSKDVKGAMIYGILAATFISWIPTPSNQAAYIGDYSSIPGAAARMEVFKQVVAAPNVDYSAGQFDWSGFGNSRLWLALITFLYVDFLDATGTFFSMANYLGQYIPNFIDEKTKYFERQMAAFCVDGASIVIGASLGLSPLTVYIESAAGIREGGRTGVTALTIAFCFFVAMFFSPLISAIPPYATGPALILVGALMMLNIIKINWASVQDAVPAFLTIAVMPLTYSIAYGLIAGIMSYILINGLVLIWNYVQAAVFPKTFPEDAMAAGNGNAFKAAWYLTVNPPAPKELVDLPDTAATLRQVTFRLKDAEEKLAAAGIAFETSSDGDKHIPKDEKV